MKNSFNDLTYNELVSKRDSLKSKYLDLRFKSVLGHVDNPLDKRNYRRQIATLNTIIHEYSLGIRKQ
ncbi:MAG: 50S ribosomal protein L29 [Spirochaetales bacterium]|nr:50S ribosomal protein L29 [Spirochaetales bacterium]